MTDKIEHFKVEAVLNRDFNTTENTNAFRVVELYINNTNEDICVVQRNNLPVILPRSSQYFGGAGNFTIRTIYHFNGKEHLVAAMNNLDRIIRDSNITNIELEIMHRALMEAYNSSNGSVNYYAVALDKEIPIKKVKQHPAIYVHEADVVICDPRAMMRCLHPYSEEGMIQNQYREFIEQRKVSGIFIELIDNDNKINTRYMYVAKKLVEVPTRVDKSKKSGVYFTRAGYDRMEEVHVEPEFFTFDDAEEQIGLHRTAEDAITDGKPESLTRIEEERARTAYLDLKTKTDRERVEAEEKLRKLQDQFEENKMRRTDFYEDRKLVRNDHYEDRSHVRKDSSEIWKFVAGMCITGLTVYAATTKANSGK